MVGLLIVVVILVTVGFFEAADASTRKHCVTSDQYGATCLTLYGNGLTVDDLIASYQVPYAGYLDGATWRFVLTTYGCDPRGVPKGQCRPTSTHADRTRVNPPPSDGAYAYASHGDFGLTVPWTVPSDQWVCVEIARRAGGQWVDNGGPNGLRACAQLHT